MRYAKRDKKNQKKNHHKNGAKKNKKPEKVRTFVCKEKGNEEQKNRFFRRENEKKLKRACIKFGPVLYSWLLFYCKAPKRKQNSKTREPRVPKTIFDSADGFYVQIKL